MTGGTSLDLARGGCANAGVVMASESKAVMTRFIG
jgi:hypothetical protein